MINPKQVVPAIVAVTLLSLAPAAEALAIEEHAQATKPTAAAGKPAAAKPAEAKADAPKHRLRLPQIRRRKPRPPQLSRPKKPTTTAATKKRSLSWSRSPNWSTPTPNTCSA